MIGASYAGFAIKLAPQDVSQCLSYTGCAGESGMEIILYWHLYCASAMLRADWPDWIKVQDNSGGLIIVSQDVLVSRWLTESIKKNKLRDWVRVMTEGQPGQASGAGCVAPSEMRHEKREYLSGHCIGTASRLQEVHQFVACKSQGVTSRAARSLVIRENVATSRTDAVVKSSTLCNGHDHNICRGCKTGLSADQLIHSMQLGDSVKRAACSYSMQSGWQLYLFSWHTPAVEKYALLTQMYPALR
ncbi:hypothetical protein BDZ91DRAFT_764874 [Kalaharituber pfeilii]|nr:hypothetical protein BDZ91DRAFT_764874 [Kalaharituber pfeilii]